MAAPEGGAITDRLITKLERFEAFSAVDRVALGRFGEDAHACAAGSDLVQQGERPTHVLLLLEGWACRYKLMPSGQRQIVAFLVPGDMCDAHVLLLPQMDYSVGALGPGRVALIGPEILADTVGSSAPIARALALATLVDAATLREWLANICQRGPYERVAHLFCEMWVRMGIVGLVSDGGFALPLTQSEIADPVGVTPVTVNRVLQRLRQARLITLRDGRLEILDLEGFMSLSGFDPSYLQCRH